MMPETNVFREVETQVYHILTAHGEYLSEMELDALREAQERLDGLADAFDSGTLLTADDEAVMDEGVDDYPRGASPHDES